MLDNIALENILFLDIETVPQCCNYDELEGPMKELWDKKAGSFRKEIVAESAMTSGRTLRLCGATGVSTRLLESGNAIGPPQLSE